MRAPRILITTALLVLGAAGGASAHPQTTWAPVGHKPLSARAAAAQVVHVPEVRSENVQANNYVPTTADLRYFRTTRGPKGQTSVSFNHWNSLVDGRDGLRNPSTDDLIQWAAHKWGVPEDWLRAQTVLESNWQMELGGDLTPVSAAWYKFYPSAAHSILGPNLIYESVGIGQILWIPDNTINVGTRYLRYRSTAFQLDYMAAEIRFYFDGACKWCKPHYHAGNQWLSLAAWNAPYPWNNSKQQAYVRAVRRQLVLRPWTLPSFPSFRLHRF